MREAGMRGILKAWAVVALLAATPALAGQAEDQIAKLMHGTFDRPDAKLAVDPVVVAGDYAIAGWSQGDLGGRALLRQHRGAWSVVLCAGDGIKSAEALRQAGIPAAEATTLVASLAEAEKHIPPERLALFAKFEGIVTMDASGAHPQHQGATK
jgi:hypothetical protein